MCCYVGGTSLLASTVSSCSPTVVYTSVDGDKEMCVIFSDSVSLPRSSPIHTLTFSSFCHAVHVLKTVNKEQTRFSHRVNNANDKWFQLFHAAVAYHHLEFPIQK